MSSSRPEAPFLSTGVSVDADHIYWANHGNHSIGRAALDGSNPNQGFITGAASPYFIAVGD